jgi:hypothetical protein
MNLGDIVGVLSAIANIARAGKQASQAERALQHLYGLQAEMVQAGLPLMRQLYGMQQRALSELASQDPNAAARARADVIAQNIRAYLRRSGLQNALSSERAIAQAVGLAARPQPFTQILGINPLAYVDRSGLQNLTQLGLLERVRAEDALSRWISVLGDVLNEIFDKDKRGGK